MMKVGLYKPQGFAAVLDVVFLHDHGVVELVAAVVVIVVLNDDDDGGVEHAYVVVVQLPRGTNLMLLLLL